MSILSSRILVHLKYWNSLGLNLLLPARCLSCGDHANSTNQLCGPCWKNLEFITTPFCERCGHPFVVEQSHLICGDCLHQPPLFAAGRAAFRYDSLIRDLILKLKHGDATYLAKPLGLWLARSGKDLLLKSDVIIPVPLHRWRLFKRRYNQATLLGRELSRHSGVPLLTNILQRRKNTESQHGKSRKARAANVKSVFKIDSKDIALLKKKSILLVDDVWTTGATLEACIKSLKRAGAKDVYVLTLARVVKGV
ncbi:ComF family protein [Candidatus Paracaedibacter symbiosus]|uniref:ComF family protein n=1 Tax=Candidatus Paracaedibacter symbiosus TaxID=244582 RepID=UPI0005098D96|nr:ComF family protein [Candidatus Paracaedibacter symbiosus]